MTEVPYSAQAIANTFLDIAAREAASASLSPMKMQKLVFFAHGWYLANTETPLVKEPIQAWQYGPVIESLYHDLKNYGSESITAPITSLNFDGDRFRTEIPKVESAEIVEFLEEIYKVYGKYSPIQLSNLSHESGSPWDLVNRESGGNLGQRSVPIPNALIQDFYAKKL